MGWWLASCGITAVDMFRVPRLRLRPARARSSFSPPNQATCERRRRRLVSDQVGATGIEYALLACFIAIAITVGTSLAGNGLNKMFYIIGNKMMTAADATSQSSN